jgi:hypothetical protein
VVLQKDFRGSAVRVPADSHGVAKTADLKLKGLGDTPIRQALTGGHSEPPSSLPPAPTTIWIPLPHARHEPRSRGLWMDESLVAELDVWQPVGLSHPIEDCAVGSVDLRRKLFGRDKTGKKVAAHSAALSKNCEQEASKRAYALAIGV